MIKNVSDEKILVTGGTGFSGGYLVQELISEGITPIVITRNAQTQVFGSSQKKIHSVECDLFDTDSVGKCLKAFRPDIIIHLAGSAYQTEVFEKLNFEATANLLEMANSMGVKKFVMTGTADEYGFQICPQSETMLEMPVSEYAVSKNKAVNRALSLYKTNNFPVVVLRPFTIYGVGQPVKMFISQAVECAVRGIPFEMSEGRQKRDVLFVTDFVNAIIKTLTAEKIEGEIFNVGSGTSVALRDLAKKIWKFAGADEKLLKIGVRVTNENELHNTEAEISKISKQLNWKPKISLDDGLKIVVEKAKNNWR